MKKLIIIIFITTAILFHYSCSHKVSSDEWIKSLEVDTTTRLEYVEMMKSINHSFNRKGIFYITSDSVNKLIMDNKNKYTRYYIGFGLCGGSIILENNLYYKLKNLLLDYTFLESSKIIDFDSSKLLSISFYSNKDSLIICDVDLNKNYDFMLEIFKKLFNDDQISRFTTYLNENRD
jgi:hypothetical protein